MTKTARQIVADLKRYQPYLVRAENRKQLQKWLIEFHPDLSFASVERYCREYEHRETPEEKEEKILSDHPFLKFK